MTWWHGVESLKQGQLLIVNKAISDVEHTPQGATVWVQGCAGTGKTLVLAHIALRLSAMQADRSIAFLTYTHALKEMISATITAGSVPVYVSTYKSYLYKKSKKYEIILIDEIQDISKDELLQLKACCTHLIVAGDCEQRIYEQGSSELEIDEIARFDKYRLVELFRVTKSIVELAKKLLSGTLLVSGEVPKDQMDIDIAVRLFDSPQQEARWVYDESIALSRPGYPSAILFPTHTEIYQFCQLLASDLEILSSGPKIKLDNNVRGCRIADYMQLNAHFEHHKIPIGYLGNGIGELSQSDSRPFAYLMTYHSAKGLDFINVFLPRLVSNIKISSFSDRALFFVAVTRARERLVVTYAGSQPYSLARLIPNFDNRIVHHNPDINDDDEGIF